MLSRVAFGTFQFNIGLKSARIRTMSPSPSSSSALSFLDRLDAHMAAPHHLASDHQLTVRSLTTTASPAQTSSTPVIRGRVRQQSQSSTNSDYDDVPLAVSRPLSSSKSKGKRKSKSSSGCDIEEVFIDPRDRLSSAAKGKGQAKQHEAIGLRPNSALDGLDANRPDYSSWTLTALQVNLNRGRGLKTFGNCQSGVGSFTNFVPFAHLRPNPASLCL